jgi:mannosyl-oligosaccharide alpha-1,2-mannosidase
LLHYSYTAVIHTQGIIDHLESIKHTSAVPGLYPLLIRTVEGSFKKNQFSFGGCGDSFYEYLLKVWLMTGRTKEQYRRMYVESMDAMIANMIQVSSEGYHYLPAGTVGYSSQSVK